MILGPGYICSLAKARLFDLYGLLLIVSILFTMLPFGLNNDYIAIWIKEKHQCIFPCINTEKSTLVLFCYFVAKKSKIARNITALLGRCFA